MSSKSSLPKKHVAIAGATGFVGRAVHASLLDQADLVALSRSVATQQTADGTQWRQCDLFELSSVERALLNCKVALYLVHSMQPRALAHGSFRDFDLLCADNFGRACKYNGVEHIIYLGGIVPSAKKLSAHLESRLEVEEALADHGVPVTSLRAALIVGAGGSSFEMMQKLVQRLPALAVPRQMRHRVQPIALADVVALIKYCIDHPAVAGSHYDIAGNEVLTYTDMLKQVARVQGRPRPVVDLPMNIPAAAHWVSAVSGYPLALVRPLVESLQHDMVAGDGKQLQRQSGISGGSFTDAVRAAHDAAEHGNVHAEQPAKATRTQRGHHVLAANRVPLTGVSGLRGALHKLRYVSDMSVTLAAERGTFDADKLRDRVVDRRILLRMRGGVLRAMDGDAQKQQVYADLREVRQRRFILATLHGCTASGLQRARRRGNIAAFRLALAAFRSTLRSPQQPGS